MERTQRKHGQLFEPETYLTAQRVTGTKHPSPSPEHLELLIPGEKVRKNTELNKTSAGTMAWARIARAGRQQRNPQS